MSKDTVYKCDLYSITENIRVLNDLSKGENIANAYAKVVDTIMVQTTVSKKYYREIITGTLIPVYRRTRKYTHGYPLMGEVVSKYPMGPVYMKFINEKEEDETPSHVLTVATFEDVENYIEEHNDVVAFKNHLDELFQTAERYYENARLKYDNTDEYKIYRLVRSIRKG